MANHKGDVAEAKSRRAERRKLIGWLCSSLLSGPALLLLRHLVFPKLNPECLVSDAGPAVNQSVVKATVAPIKDPPTPEVNWMEKKDEKRYETRVVPPQGGV